MLCFGMIFINRSKNTFAIIPKYTILFSLTKRLRPRLKSWCKLKEPKALVSLYNVIAKKNTKEKQKQWLRYRLH